MNTFRLIFRKIFNNRRIYLGRQPDGLWVITTKRVVDNYYELQNLQQLKKRKGKSVLVSNMAFSDEAIREIIWLYQNHPDNYEPPKSELIDEIRALTS